MRFILFTISFLILLISCSKKVEEVKPKKYSEEEYKVLLQKKEFLKKVNPVAVENVSPLEKYIIAQVIKPERSIVFVIKPPSPIERVLYMNIKSKAFGLDFIAIEGYDFFVDPFSDEILLSIKIPYIYTLKGRVVYDVYYVYQGEDGNIRFGDKRIVVLYKPFEKGKPYNYITDLDELIEYFADNDEVRKKIKEEFKRVNINRFPEGYKKLLIKLKEEIE
ncbi:MAG: hypothetical protein DSY42_02620 [Aquifex sp.]|nr:MAG: hypothetical protein DSY42_02620 [Aquifex sp.]